MGAEDEDESPFNFHNRNESYDFNSRIMLIAIISLSLVVILVTILHIYARCVLRRQARRQAALRRLGFITTTAVSIHAAAEPPKTGLDQSVIAALPTFTFRQTTDHTEPANELSSFECSVCLSMLEDGDIARTLPNCKHTFHAECIDQWFGSNSTCPVCRTEAQPRLVVEEPPEGVNGAPPSAPPLEATSDGAQLSDKIVSGSSSRLSSFRRMISRERSSRRMQVQSRGEEDGLPDLERQ